MNNYFSELKTKIRLLPTDLKLLFWFAVFSFFPFLLFFIFAREQLYEKILPYIGWSQMTIYFCITIMLLSKPKTLINTNQKSFNEVRNRIIFVLAIYLILGTYDWFETTPEWYIHKNPYLRYDTFRPIFTILFPLFWILILSWSFIKGFVGKKLKIQFKF